MLPPPMTSVNGYACVRWVVGDTNYNNNNNQRSARVVRNFHMSQSPINSWTSRKHKNFAPLRFGEDSWITFPSQNTKQVVVVRWWLKGAFEFANVKIMMMHSNRVISDSHEVLRSCWTVRDHRVNSLSCVFVCAARSGALCNRNISECASRSRVRAGRVRGRERWMWCWGAPFEEKKTRNSKLNIISVVGWVGRKKWKRPRSISLLLKYYFSSPFLILCFFSSALGLS